MECSAVLPTLVGMGMIGHWLFSLATGRVPELETEPLRIRFCLLAESVTAASLLVGGIALLTSAIWGPWLYLLAIGMLLYTAIVSPGCFAEQGRWGQVGFFALLLVLAVVSVALVV